MQGKHVSLVVYLRTIWTHAVWRKKLAEVHEVIMIPLLFYSNSTNTNRMMYYEIAKKKTFNDCRSFRNYVTKIRYQVNIMTGDIQSSFNCRLSGNWLSFLAAHSGVFERETWSKPFWHTSHYPIELKFGMLTYFRRQYILHRL